MQPVQPELTQVGIDIARLHSELDQHQSRMTDLRGYLNAAPQVAAEYARLNRDRDAINAQYTALRESLEKARVAERAVRVEPVRFEIVQPATAPYGPVWPRRKLYVAAVLAVAVAAGAALAYGMNCLFPVVNSGGSLARVIGVPVHAEVTSAFPERDRRAFRRDLLRISGYCLLARGVRCRQPPKKSALAETETAAMGRQLGNSLKQAPPRPPGNTSS